MKPLALCFLAALSLQAQPVPAWRALPGFLEMTVGPKLCRWWAFHATAQIEVACQANGVYDHIAIGKELNGFYRLDQNPITLPAGVAVQNVTGGAVTALLYPLVSGAISWLVTASGGMFRYQIVGWPAGGLPAVETGVF